MPGPPCPPDDTDDWPTWSRWVRLALKRVIVTGDNLTTDVAGIKEQLLPRVAVLEERCSPEKIKDLTEGVQNNKVSLAKLGGVGIVSGGMVAAAMKLAEALAATVKAGGLP